MQLESALWNWLREGNSNLIKSKKLHICRVENSITSGYPDVEGCYNGVCFTIELKCADRPARGTTPVRVRWRPAQRPWLLRRWHAGGRAFLLLAVGNRRQVRRYLVPAPNCKLVGSVPEADLFDLSIIKTDFQAEETIKTCITYR